MRRLMLLAVLSVLCFSPGALGEGKRGALVVPPEPFIPAPPAREPPPESPIALELENVPLADVNGLSVSLAMTEALFAAQENADSLRPFDDFWGYRAREDLVGWMAGDGDQFGDFLFAWDHYQPSGVTSGLSMGAAFHFLAGPERTDMPPRLFNFSLGYQKRHVMGDFAYDVAAAVMAASDFEGSSRRGIRLPAHAVAYLALESNLDVALGADFLDRADIPLLPVVGLIWRPSSQVRLELLFPYPRMYVQLAKGDRLYCGGGLGGGTWAIERDNEVDDLATYRDLRIAVGLEHWDSGPAWKAFEIAYLFDRRLQFTSQAGDYCADATVLIQSVCRY
ncbi:MAG: hypothetical protein ACYC0X_19445 [Pirellulaceae bacterium]